MIRYYLFYFSFTCNLTKKISLQRIDQSAERKKSARSVHINEKFVCVRLLQLRFPVRLGSLWSRFFSSKSPQLGVDLFKLHLFGASVEDNTTGTASHLEKWHRWMWAELRCEETVYSHRYLQLESPWLMRHTQKTSFSHHLRSIRPLLIPWLSPVQCSCIWWSQANTLPFLQHSILITFLCFLPSLHPSFLWFLVITQEKTHNRRGGRSVVLISWQFTPSWFWMTDNLLKYCIWFS